MLVFVVALGSVLNCGSENISHPNIEGDWLLIKQSGQDVPGEEQVALRVTPSTLEARDAQTGAPQFGGPRTYKWAGGVMVVEPLDGEKVSDARVLSTANQSMEIDRLFEWPRSAFKRYSDKEWNALVKLHEDIQKENATGGMALLADGKTWDRKFLAHLHDRLQGIWEKKDLPPYKNVPLLVEISGNKIRAQMVMLLRHQDLLGKEEPCTFELKTPREADVFCPNNGKTYPMAIRFSSDSELEVQFRGFEFELFRTDEQAFKAISEKTGVDFRRLNP